MAVVSLMGYGRRSVAGAELTPTVCRHTETVFVPGVLARVVLGIAVRARRPGRDAVWADLLLDRMAGVGPRQETEGTARPGSSGCIKSRPITAAASSLDTTRRDMAGAFLQWGRTLQRTANIRSKNMGHVCNEPVLLGGSARCNRAPRVLQRAAKNRSRNNCPMVLTGEDRAQCAPREERSGYTARQLCRRRTETAVIRRSRMDRDSRDLTRSVRRTDELAEDRLRRVAGRRRLC